MAIDDEIDLSYSSFDITKLDFTDSGLDNLLCQYNKAYDRFNDYEKNNIRKYLKIILQELSQVTQIGSEIDGILDIDNVSGSALDFIGSLVGIDRTQCAAICQEVFTPCTFGLGTTGPNPPTVPNNNLDFFVVEDEEVSGTIISDPFIEINGGVIILSLQSNNLPDTIDFIDTGSGSFILSGSFEEPGSYSLIVMATSGVDGSTSAQFFSVTVTPAISTTCPEFISEQLIGLETEGNINNLSSIIVTLRIGNLVKFDGTQFQGYKITRNSPLGLSTPLIVENQSSGTIQEFYTETLDADRWSVNLLSGDSISFGSYTEGDLVANNLTITMVVSDNDFTTNIDNVEVVEKNYELQIRFFCDETQNIIVRTLNIKITGYKIVINESIENETINFSDGSNSTLINQDP